MGLNNAGDFNMACEEGHATDLINVAGLPRTKKIAQIADTIFHRGENGDRIKLVLIADRLVGERPPAKVSLSTDDKRQAIRFHWTILC